MEVSGFKTDHDRLGEATFAKLRCPANGHAKFNTESDAVGTESTRCDIDDRRWHDADVSGSKSELARIC